MLLLIDRDFDSSYVAKNISAFKSMIGLFLKNGVDAPTNHIFIIIPSIFVFIIEDYKSLRMKPKIFLCFSYIILSSLIFGLYYFYPFRITFDFLGNKFDWSRFLDKSFNVVYTMGYSSY